MISEHDSMGASAYPEDSAPIGVGGLLLFYALFPTGLSGVVFPIWLVVTGNGLEFVGIVELEALLLALNVIGLYLIFFVRRPITRYFHIGLNAAIATEFLVVGLMDSDLIAMVGGVAAFVIWSGYWFWSKRVRATYRASA